MARMKKAVNLDEQMTSLDILIESKESELRELKKQKEELKEEKIKQQKDKIYKLLDDNNVSIDDLEKLLKNKKEEVSKITKIENKLEKKTS